MAKLTINLDTDTKDFTVSVNNEVIDNVHSVDIYKEYTDHKMSDYRCSFRVNTYSKDEDVTKYLSIIAKNSRWSDDALKSNGKTIGDLIISLQNPIKDQIQNYFNNK